MQRDRWKVRGDGRGDGRKTKEQLTSKMSIRYPKITITKGPLYLRDGQTDEHFLSQL